MCEGFLTLIFNNFHHKQWFGRMPIALGNSKNFYLLSKYVKLQYNTYNNLPIFLLTSSLKDTELARNFVSSYVLPLFNDETDPILFKIAVKFSITDYILTNLKKYDLFGLLQKAAGNISIFSLLIEQIALDETDKKVSADVLVKIHKKLMKIKLLSKEDVGSRFDMLLDLGSKIAYDDFKKDDLTRFVTFVGDRATKMIDHLTVKQCSSIICSNNICRIGCRRQKRWNFTTDNRVYLEEVSLIDRKARRVSHCTNKLCRYLV